MKTACTIDNRSTFVRPPLQMFVFRREPHPTIKGLIEPHIYIQPGNRDLLNVAAALPTDRIDPAHLSKPLGWGRAGGGPLAAAHILLGYLFDRATADRLMVAFCQQVIAALGSSDRLSSEDICRWVENKDMECKH